MRPNVSFLSKLILNWSLCICYLVHAQAAKCVFTLLPVFLVHMSHAHTHVEANLNSERSIKICQVIEKMLSLYHKLNSEKKNASTLDMFLIKKVNTFTLIISNVLNYSVLNIAFIVFSFPMYL